MGYFDEESRKTRALRRKIKYEFREQQRERKRQYELKRLEEDRRRAEKERELMVAREKVARARHGIAVSKHRIERFGRPPGSPGGSKGRGGGGLIDFDPLGGGVGGNVMDFNIDDILFGGGGPGPSRGPKKKKRSKGKKRGSRKKSEYVVIGGKAYKKG